MIDEEKLQIAAKEAAEAILQSLPAKKDIAYTPSSSFVRRMKKLIFRTKHPILYQSARGAACLLALVLSGSVLLFGISSDVRAAVLGWFKQLKGDTHFEYDFEGDNAVDMSGVRYEPGWVPEGFELVVQEVDDNGGMYVYSNGSEYVTQLLYIIASNSGDAKMLMDGNDPNYECEYIQIKDYDAELYISKSDEHTDALIWIDENSTLFYFTGKLSKEEMVKVAENVQKIKMKIDNPL